MVPKENKGLFRHGWGMVVLVGFLTLVSCGPNLSGTYSGAGLVLKFGSNGKVQMSSQLMPGIGTEFPYKVEGNELKIEAGAQGALVMTILSDGTIKGPLGTVLSKEANDEKK